jgi:hypothetical protein
MPLAAAARVDADRYARVWEISERGAAAPETAGARCEVVHEGRIRVRRCDKPASAVIDDLVLRLAEARVSVVGRDGVRDCPWAGDRFACEDAAVSLAVGEIDYAPHRCVLAEPPRDAALRIEWPDVTLSRSLVGYTGVHSFYARKSATEPFAIALTVGDAPPFAFVYHNDDGWRRLDRPTPAGHAPVRVEITTSRATGRKLCFALESRS